MQLPTDIGYSGACTNNCMSEPQRDLQSSECPLNSWDNERVVDFG